MAKSTPEELACRKVIRFLIEEANTCLEDALQARKGGIWARVEYLARNALSLVEASKIVEHKSGDPSRLRDERAARRRIESFAGAHLDAARKELQARRETNATFRVGQVLARAFSGESR